jgi:hypothetical protein
VQRVQKLLREAANEQSAHEPFYSHSSEVQLPASRLTCSQSDEERLPSSRLPYSHSCE